MLLVAPGPYRGGLYRCVQLDVAGHNWASQVQPCLERGRTPVPVGGGRRWHRRAEQAQLAELAAALDSLRPVAPANSEPGRLWLLGVSLVAGAEKTIGEQAATLEQWLTRLYPAVSRMVDLDGRDDEEVHIVASEVRLLLDELRSSTDRLIAGELSDRHQTPPIRFT